VDGTTRPSALAKQLSEKPYSYHSTDEDNLWTGSIDSLRTLAEVVLSQSSSLIDEEKKAFYTAGKFAAETLVENAETADEVQTEVSELEGLAKR
jgi:hypothetical protein